MAETFCLADLAEIRSKNSATTRICTVLGGPRDTLQDALLALQEPADLQVTPRAARESPGTPGGPPGGFPAMPGPWSRMTWRRRRCPPGRGGQLDPSSALLGPA
jgi:hypothetical protein